MSDYCLDRNIKADLFWFMDYARMKLDMDIEESQRMLEMATLSQIKDMHKTALGVQEQQKQSIEDLKKRLEVIADCTGG